MNRTKGIGGTDIGAIIGVNPWKSAMDVYLDKLGITEPQADNEAMYWGREMEPVLAKRYLKETNEELFIPNADILPYRHPEFPWYLGSPDALVYPASSRNYCPTSKGGVDFKTTGRRDGWGSPGTDEVPEWIHTQADWYMGLTGAEWWDIAVLFFSPRREFAIYRIPRNQELIDNLIEAGQDFWENHVVLQVPPPIDSSEGSKRLLNHLYPESRGEVLPAPDNALGWRTKLENANAVLKEFEEYKKLAQHHLEVMVGDADSLLWPDGWRFDWKKQKDRTIIDWEEVAKDMEHFLPSDKSLRDFISQRTTIKPGPRVPRLYGPKEK